MKLFNTLKKLAIIVWKDGKLSGLWAVASGVPSVIQVLTERWPDLMGRATSIVEPVQWWWGLPILFLWIIVSLSRRILSYEKATLEIEAIKDARDGSWWLEVTNSGALPVNSCAVDFERIETADGKRVFPHSFGLARPGNLSNPFPLRPSQPKQGRFAEVVDENITIWGMMVDKTVHEISLQEVVYSVTVGVYSELNGAQCKRRFTLRLEAGELVCEPSDTK